MLIVLQFCVPLVCMMGKVNTQVSHEESYQDQIDQLDREQEKREVRSDYYQEIAKCCPEGLHMDDWYKCVKNKNVDQDMFTEELLEIGAKAKEK